jgi:hypothetical protein
MRPNGPTQKLGDFPLFGSSNPNPAIRFALYKPRSGAQIPGQAWIDQRPAPTPDAFVCRAHAKGKYVGKGRTNGLPWDTTSPCTVSTRFDNGPSRKPAKAGPRWDQQLEAAQAAGDWATVAKLALLWGERTSDTPEISVYLRGVLEHALKMRFES